MQIPPDIVSLSGTPGPFATVLLDITRSVAQADKEIELRWRALRAQLESGGAPPSVLAAIDGAVGTHDAAGERGQVIVANGEGVVFDRTEPRRPRRDEARWAPLPHLVPYLASLEPAIPYVLVTTDRTGADLSAVSAQQAAEHRPEGRLHVTGSQPYPITKTSVRDPSERSFQQRVENSWAVNARDVADAVATQVGAVGARVVLVDGDVRARALLREDLPRVLHPDVTVIELEDGAIRESLLRHSWAQRRRVLEHLRQNLGRRHYAVAGAADVLVAARRAQIDTVVLSDDPSSTLRAWVGPEPAQLALDRDEVVGMGISEPLQDRYDAALLRALTGSGADIVITPNAHDYVQDGIAALLRYSNAATPEQGS